MLVSIVPKCASASPNVLSVANPLILPEEIFTLTLLLPTHASRTSTPVSIFPKWVSAFAMLVSIVPKCASASVDLVSITPKCASALPNVVSVANPLILPLLIFTFTLLEPTHASIVSTALSISLKWVLEASSIFTLKSPLASIDIGQ